MELEGATCAKAPILRTPQDRENHRKSLYKSGSPAWKGAYRKVGHIHTLLGIIVK